MYFLFGILKLSLHKSNKFLLISTRPFLSILFNLLLKFLRKEYVDIKVTNLFGKKIPLFPEAEALQTQTH